MLTELAISVALTATMLMVIGTAGFCLAIVRFRSTTTTAVAAALATMGVAGWVSFWAYLATPTLGQLTGWAILAVAAVTIGFCARNLEVRRAAIRVLPAAVMAVGLVAVTVGLIGLWGINGDPFGLGRVRFSHPLPLDNQIPQMFLDKLVAHQDPRNFLKPDWQSSDRPPLQTGLMLIAYPFTKSLGFAEGISGLGAGIACEVVWMPALAILVRAIGGRRRGVLAAMVFTALANAVLVNTVFTWPKLLSAAFVLAATALFAQPLAAGSRFRAGTFALSGVLFALGMLSHGAALFALPIPLLVLLRRHRALGLRPVGALIGAGVITYLPWVAYQRFYDPPGSRLLSIHLGGVLPRPGDGGVLHEIVHHYAAIGLTTALDNKWLNLLVPFSEAPWRGISLQGFDIRHQRVAQFFTFSGAIGVGWIAALAVLVALLVARLRRAERDPYGAQVLSLMVFGLVSIVVWALVMFGPSATLLHQGSHVFVLIGLGVPIAWLVDRRPRIGVPLLLAGLAFHIIVAVPFDQNPYVPAAAIGTISRHAVALALAGALAVAAAFLLTHPRLSSGWGGAARSGERASLQTDPQDELSAVAPSRPDDPETLPEPVGVPAPARVPVGATVGHPDGVV